MKRLFSLLLVVVMFLTSAVAVLAGYPDPGSGKTNIFMQNLGSNPATVSLVFTKGDTGENSGTYTTSDPIPARGSKRLLYTEFPAGVTDGWAGAVEVSATEPLAAIVNVLWDSATVRAAGTYKGIDTPDTKAYLPLLAVRPDLQTSRITVQNTEDSDAHITIRFYNRDGANVTGAGYSGTSYSATIPPKSEKTFALDVLQPDFAGTGGLGSAYITSDKKIATVGSIHWTNGSDAYSGVASGDTVLWIPNAWRRFNSACGDHNNTACYSNFSVATIQNLGDTTAHVTVEFWKDDGTRTHSLTDDIPPKASKAYNMAIKGTMDPAKFSALATALGDNWRGTIKVISDGPALTGVCTYFARSTGTLDTMIYSAIRQNEATSNALSFPAVYRKLAAPPASNAPTDQWSTTLIQNLSSTPGTLTVRFYQASNGAEVPGGPWTVPIAGNGSVGLNLLAGVQLPADALTALGNGFSGAMYVTPSSGLQIVGVTCLYWSGVGRAASYTGFPIPTE